MSRRRSRFQRQPQRACPIFVAREFLTDKYQIQNVQFVQFSNDADSEPWMLRAEALDFIAECDRQAIFNVTRTYLKIADCCRSDNNVE